MTQLRAGLLRAAAVAGPVALLLLPLLVFLWFMEHRLRPLLWPGGVAVLVTFSALTGIGAAIVARTCAERPQRAAALSLGSALGAALLGIAQAAYLGGVHAEGLDAGYAHVTGLLDEGQGLGASTVAAILGLALAFGAPIAQHAVALARGERVSLFAAVVGPWVAALGVVLVGVLVMQTFPTRGPDRYLGEAVGTFALASAAGLVFFGWLLGLLLVAARAIEERLARQAATD